MQLQNSLISFPLNSPFLSSALLPKANNFRAGDWICLSCRNLNFSFREKCNRCFTQSKTCNFAKTQSLLGDSAKSTLSNDSMKNSQISGNGGNSWNTEKMMHSPLIRIQGKQDWRVWDEESEDEGNMRPYVSPAKLPSVSPIMKTLRKELDEIEVRPFSLSDGI